MTPATTLKVGVVGGSGYTGGELLRYLRSHPRVTVTQITSRDNAGHYVHAVHPGLRGRSSLQFIHPDALTTCDALFLCLPHGEAARQIDRLAALAPVIIDLSADFRLHDSDAYARWYGGDSDGGGESDGGGDARPAAWVDRFVYGLPEVNRDRLRGASCASGVGCNATAVNLALLPLARAGLIDYAACAVSVGSSEGGAVVSTGSHHPIRSGAVRTYKATGHRHGAEVALILGAGVRVHLAITAIEMIRGVHVVAHVTTNAPLTDKELWRLYRGAYKDEPFVRLVAGKTGMHRLPEPRIVAGTNFCDVGFELDADDPRHVVVVSALDNLGKGAAGSAVQCLNLMCGFDEMDGLDMIGVYP
ncbi:MAG: N-acetyl-gamma-glutamyl-phosphate reductase [Chloroflexota bacterium]|nr:N-acetyl-gamma-glutamyl-phosphate reductase [Chloroflexota bacterium]